MVDNAGKINVIEFNARFGDPETQVVLPLLDTDLADIMIAVTDAHLHEIKVAWRRESAVSVVMAAGGYPGPYGKGDVVEGMEQVAELSDVVVFQAGTSFDADGKIVTSGGRVLSVTGVGTDFNQARARAYASVRAIRFEGGYYRSDIGYQALESAG
jgi:phosphoribosylamine--glycine ligase